MRVTIIMIIIIIIINFFVVIIDNGYCYCHYSTRVLP